MTQKQCTKCKQTKHIEEFRLLKNRGRYMSECKACERDRSRKYQPLVRPNRRSLAVREVAILCKMFGTDILADAVAYLKENNL